MSDRPGQKIYSQQEMAFKTGQAAERAERRVAAAEARLASVEARLAEKDQAISELAAAFSKAHESISAMSVVLGEIQEKGPKGIDQVLTALDGRIKAVEGDLESTRPRYQQFFDLLTSEMPSLRDIMDATVALEQRLEEYDETLELLVDSREAHSQRLKALETKPKRGRPKGSKNKPKVEQQTAEQPENPPSDKPEVENAS